MVPKFYIDLSFSPATFKTTFIVSQLHFHLQRKSMSTVCNWWFKCGKCSTDWSSPRRPSNQFLAILIILISHPFGIGWGKTNVAFLILSRFWGWGLPNCFSTQEVHFILGRIWKFYSYFVLGLIEETLILTEKVPKVTPKLCYKRAWRSFWELRAKLKSIQILARSYGLIDGIDLIEVVSS